jgi:hypothetical protein
MIMQLGCRFSSSVAVSKPTKTMARIWRRQWEFRIPKLSHSKEKDLRPSFSESQTISHQGQTPWSSYVIHLFVGILSMGLS